MRRVLAELDRVAPTSASVLMIGESGTGKEALARRVHEKSGRPGPFVAINCAALPDSILESLLFGHRKGAFSGAVEAHRGLFLEAERGTVFLDEVAELSAAAQGKLLRALQEKSVLPVGESRERRVDVRIVCATHGDLQRSAGATRFREDLYYRLARYPVQVPPLRDRGSDILVIAADFLSSCPDLESRPRRLARSADAVLLSYSWPGNVRELQNVLFRAAVLEERDEISASTLTEVLGGAGATALAPRDRVLAHIHANGWATSGQLAIALGMHVSSMKRVLKRLVAEGLIVMREAGRSTHYKGTG